MTRRLPPACRASAARWQNDNEREVVLLADTFNRYFERENLDAAVTVLQAAGYTVHIAKPADGSKRPLCCGRTFLSVGRVDQARREAERVIAAVAPFVTRGVPVIGLEPSCILGFRDEVPAMIKSEGATQLSMHALMFEEFLVREAARRPAQPAAQADREARADPRPLPSEGVRHDRRGRAHPEAGPGSEGRDRGVELLRHGGRVRLRRRHDRCLDGDGRALAAARRAQGRRRHAHRRGRHLLPPPDPRRRAARRAACRPRAGDECGWHPETCRITLEG